MKTKTKKLKNPVRRPKPVPIEAMEAVSVGDVLVTAVNALEKANQNLADIMYSAQRPVPNKALDRLLGQIPDIVTAYFTMLHADRRVEPAQPASTNTAAMFERTSAVFELIASLTENQRTSILAGCTGSQQKVLLEIFASIPTPIRPPAS